MDHDFDGAERDGLLRSSKNRQIFRAIYQDNFWNGSRSRSGPGSEGDFAAQKTDLLRAIIYRYQIRSILDIGCGAFYWIQHVAEELNDYVGLDIVPELLVVNRERYARRNVQFLDIDLTANDGCPSALKQHWILIVCLDVFGHLLNHEVDHLISMLSGELTMAYLWVTNRRDPGSQNYLRQSKSKLEGIDIEAHPAFPRDRWHKLESVSALYRNDWFDLYACAKGRDV